MRKKKNFINSILPLCAFGILILVVSVILKIVPDGSDTSSREKILHGMDSAQQWVITEETLLEDHLLAKVNADNRSGIAVFKPVGDGYTCIAFETAPSDEIVHTYTTVNEYGYDCFRFIREDLHHFEILYNANTEPMKFICNPDEIFWISAPDEKYTIQITYFDEQGNVIGKFPE